MGSRRALVPLRLPSVTTTQRGTLSGVADGDAIFNSTFKRGEVRSNGLWVPTGGLVGMAALYAFATSTSDSDPGAGTLRLNNATPGSASAVFMDVLDAQGLDVTSMLTHFYGGSGNDAFKLQSVDDPTKYVQGWIVGYDTPSGYLKWFVIVTASSGTFSAGELVILTGARAGTDGAAGADGADAVSNLLPNGGAETGSTSPWATSAEPDGVVNAGATLAVDTGDFATGRGSAREFTLTIPGPSSQWRGMWQSITGLDANTTYTFRVWLKKGTYTSTVIIAIRDHTNGIEVDGSSIVLTTDWVMHEVTLTTGATGNVTLTVAVEANVNGITSGTVKVDDGYVYAPDSGVDEVDPGYGLFGDGSDGVVNFDGSATVLGLAPSSGVYSLTRDVYLADGSQVSGSAVIACRNYRIFCTGTFKIGASAVVRGDGFAAATAPNAGSAVTAGVYASQGGGGAGKSGTAGAGTAGAAVTGSVGGAGGAGGIASGSGTGGGAAGGTVTAPAAADGVLPRNYFAAVQGYFGGSGIYLRSGAGGGGGTNTTSSTGGGGGGAGSIVCIVVKKLVNLGAITSKGGAGGAATGTGTGAGGGGGGGGGTVIVVCGPDSTVGTLTVTGGAGGARQGVGANGAAGSGGQTFTLNV